MRKCSFDSTAEIENAPISTAISFANSAGWKLKGPNASQRCAPFTVVPTKRTAISRNTVMPIPTNISPRMRW